MQLQPLVVEAIPPIELDHVLDPAPREPVLQAERHEEARRAAALLGELAHRFLVEMVVVVMRDHHRVDVRQLGERRHRLHHALRPREADRRGALGKMRIGEHIQPAHAQQNGRMPDPGHRRIGGKLRLRGLEAVAVFRILRQAVAQLVPLPAPEAALLGVRVVVAKALGRAVRLGRIEVLEAHGDERPEEESDE